MAEGNKYGVPGGQRMAGGDRVSISKTMMIDIRTEYDQKKAEEEANRKSYAASIRERFRIAGELSETLLAENNIVVLPERDQKLVEALLGNIESILGIRI